jgi:hypothetical protein
LNSNLQNLGITNFERIIKINLLCFKLRFFFFFRIFFVLCSSELLLKLSMKKKVLFYFIFQFRLRKQLRIETRKQSYNKVKVVLAHS